MMTKQKQPTNEQVLLGKLEYIMAYYVSEGEIEAAEAVHILYELLPDSPVLAVIAAEDLKVADSIVREIRKVFGIVAHFL